MRQLFQFGGYAGFVLFGGFLAVICWKLVNGEISLDGLMDSNGKDGVRSYSPERAQLMLFTLFVAGKYLLDVFQNPRVDSLPGLSTQIVAMLGGSQAIYVGGKAWSTWIKKE